MSAMPSLGPSGNSPRPAAASPPAASLMPPGRPASSEPMPTSGPNACASGMISPALPTPPRGTAGTRPAFSTSASRWHSAADTPASPFRNVRSRTAKIARTSPYGSQGGPPTARASIRFRWCARCWPSVRATPDSAPMPVFTPYTGPPPASTARARSHCRCTSSSSDGARATGRPSAIDPIRPGPSSSGRATRAGPVQAGPVLAGSVTGSAARCRPRPPRPGAGSAVPPRRRAGTGRGARTGSFRPGIHDLAAGR